MTKEAKIYGGNIFRLFWSRKKNGPIATPDIPFAILRPGLVPPQPPFFPSRCRFPRSLCTAEEGRVCAESASQWGGKGGIQDHLRREGGRRRTEPAVCFPPLFFPNRLEDKKRGLGSLLAQQFCTTFCRQYTYILLKCAKANLPFTLERSTNNV